MEEGSDYKTKRIADTMWEYDMNGNRWQIFIYEMVSYRIISGWGNEYNSDTLQSMNWQVPSSALLLQV